jgi:myo-inositol-1(or 4)-monophosphatase
MHITNFRIIGKRLMEEISPFIGNPHFSQPLAKGASGDMTYPIDKKAEDIVFEEVEKLHEPFTIVSEECGFKDIKGGGPKLLIDPIDGSKNALTGLPLFSSSIALVEGETLDHITAGYIINLVNGDEFWVQRGKGSFFNGIPVKTQEDAECRIVTYEVQNPKNDIPGILPLLSLFRRTRCLGSIAMDLALLAKGSASVFINPTPSRSFDFAAGYLLIKEAGGYMTNLKGEEIAKIPVGIEKITPILASGNWKLHEKALEALKT